MPSRHRFRASLLGLPLLLAACGGSSATPTPAPTPQATASPTATPRATAPVAASPAPSTDGSGAPGASVGVTAGPSGSPAATGASPAPSAVALHADAALEALLPAMVDGQGVHVETVKAADYLQLIDPASDASHQLQRFLMETAADPSRITIAFGGWGSGDTEQVFQAYRAPGARPDRLLAATVYLMRSATGDPAKATVATTRIGNRTVTTVTGEGDAPITISVFVEGELAVVTAAAPDQVALLLDALP